MPERMLAVDLVEQLKPLLEDLVGEKELQAVDVLEKFIKENREDIAITVSRQMEIAESVGAAQPVREVYTQPNCIYMYCPCPDYCKEKNTCNNPV